MNTEVLKFLQRYENKSGKVGEFVRSCLLVSDLSEFTDRETLLRSAQLGYLLDCFSSSEENDAE